MKSYQNRDFPRTDLGPNNRPFQIKKWAKTSQNGEYHSQFLSSTFWWKFHENLNKIAKLQMHKKLHKMFMQIFMYFYGRQLKQLYTASFLYVF